jgi:hypothetical protein
MIQFILIIIGLYVIISKPALILLGGAAWLTWLILKHPDSFTLLPRHLTTPGGEDQEPESDLSRDKGFTTYEERIEREMSNHKFKEGFQDDPEWKKQADRAREYIQKARDLEEAELNTLGQNIKNQV